MKNKRDIQVKTVHKTYAPLQSSIIALVLISGCVSEAAFIQQQEGCVHVLLKGKPNVQDEKWKNMSEADYSAAKGWWNDCNRIATEETKAKANPATAWERVDAQIAKGNYHDAWTLITIAVPYNEVRINKYLANYPKLYEAAMNLFSIDQLRKKSGYDASYIYNQLDIFKKHAKISDYNKSKSNVELIYRKHMVNGKLSDIIVYGRISGTQIEDRSHINSGNGANLGAITGQAIYIDNTNWKNYSALNQLGAGLLGAMVGSTLDQPTSIQYQRTYWITLTNGETISMSSIVSDQTHVPNGVCVEVSGSSLAPTNDSKCKPK